VRHSVVFWLLLSAVLGGGLGVGIAHRAGGSTSVDASAPVVVARGSTASNDLVPRLVYWNVRRHLARDLETPGLHPLSVPAARSHFSSSPSQSSANANPSGEIVTFSSTPRTFAVDPSPSDGGGETTTSTAPSSTTTTPVSTTPIVISNVHTVSLSPFNATIAWQTSEPVSSRISYGLNGPTLWTPATDGVDHTATVTGLTFGTSYRLWVNANAADGRSASLPYMLTTPPLSDSPTVSTGSGTVQLDGQLTFPTIVMGACPESFSSLLSAGIDFFMDDRSCDLGPNASALNGHAFVLETAKHSPVPGSVGSFLPDEWDTFLPSTLTAAQASKLVPNLGGGPRWLTLTNHFYSGADPLPQGRGMYPALVAQADVLGFDLYPLQNWCRYDGAFKDVFDSQHELVALGGGKPTFQWIESRMMDCHNPVLTPTPQTVSAETWLAIAGGAHAIGYFPYDFSADIGASIAQAKSEIETLAPALVEPALPTSIGDGSIRVGAREHNGALYVIAVNATRNPVTTTITVPALGNRSLVSLDGTRSVTAASGAFTDSFGPLEVHIYISAPPTS
jgi:hypothetical protein